MCGINAVYSRDALHKAVQIAIEQEHRGTLGTGLAYICNNNIKILKEPVAPRWFYNKYKFKLSNDYDIAICHNRMPSQGGINMQNTHPFASCNRQYAFIHNGNASINKIRKILKFYGHTILGDTDSEVLCHLLEIYYWNNSDWFKALEEFAHDYLGGAIIILTKDGVIYGVRNSTYPLNCVVTNKGIYLASEVQAIETVIDRYNEKIKEKFSLQSYKPIMIHNYRYTYYGKKEEVEKEEILYIYPYEYNTYIIHRYKHRDRRHRGLYDKEWLEWVWDYP